MNTELIPRQKLPSSKKGTEWGKDMMDELDRLSMLTDYNGRSTKYIKQVNCDLYNGLLNQTDFEYVLNPYGFKSGEFPANLQHYDIISPKLNLLFGEEIKRPFNFTVVATNPEAISEYQEEQKKMFHNVFSTMIQEEIDKQTKAQQQKAQAEQQMQAGQGQGPVPQQQQQSQQPQIKLPRNLEELEKYMNEEYKSLREIAAQMALTYLLEKEKLKLKFNDMWKDSLLMGEEIAYIGSRGGDPHLRVCNPKDIVVVSDPDSPWIEDAIAVIEERWLSPSTILDEFYDELTPKQIDDIERMAGKTARNEDTLAYPESTLIIKGPEEYAKAQSIINTHDQDGTIRVIHAEWRSMRKIGIIEIDGEEDIVGEEFQIAEDAIKLDKDEEWQYEWEQDGMHVNFSWFWVNEVWEGTKIGQDIYVDIQPKKNQRRSMDNISKCKLGYVGYIYNSRNSQSVSLVDRMKPYQYLYDIIYYRTELGLAKNKGRIMLMDLAQIPSSMGWDVDKWMYYLEAMNIGFINSAEEQPNGQRANFNQFQAVDLSMGSFVDQHVKMLNEIEEKIGELSGVSRQRQGQVSSSELVGNTERAVVQSSHITEPWFYYHNEVKKRCLTALLEVAQMVWKKGKKINHIFDDMTRMVFEIEPDIFCMSEYSIFVVDGSKEMKIKSTMEQMATNAYQSGTATSIEAITMLEYDSIAQMKKKLKELDAKKQQMQQAMAENESKMKQQEFQQEAQLKLQLDQNETMRSHEDNQTKIVVAEINAQAKLDSTPDTSGESDLERQKIQIQRDKIMQELGLKKDKLANDDYHKTKAEELKEKEIAIKRTQANKPAASK